MSALFYLCLSISASLSTSDFLDFLFDLLEEWSESKLLEDEECLRLHNDEWPYLLQLVFQASLTVCVLCHVTCVSAASSPCLWTCSCSSASCAASARSSPRWPRSPRRSWVCPWPSLTTLISVWWWLGQARELVTQHTTQLLAPIHTLSLFSDVIAFYFEQS